MNYSEFNDVMEELITTCKTVLKKKESEYGGNYDRLEQFKRVGALLNQSPEQALVGMWAKHVSSIVSMIEDRDNIGTKYSWNKWMEKIVDAINYLILLTGLITESIITSNKEEE